ncbi:MAG: hypothetical protein N3B11_05735, partial [Coriobacteriia bacterium]|nr:hypothetical protein [Coriobacteriia bacterium]
MMAGLPTGSRRAPAALVAAFLALIVLGQAGAESVLPEAQRTATARVIERAGWSYLGGLRTFAAAVMWNRIEPIFHA